MNNEEPAKHPAAVALGSIKTTKKAEASRQNGRKPCAPGKKRGRPRKEKGFLQARQEEQAMRRRDWKGGAK